MEFGWILRGVAMEMILSEFKKFCTDHYIKASKAPFYVRSIAFLCEFLGIAEINSESVSKFEGIKIWLADVECELYQGFMNYLGDKNKCYYLTDGFVQYAVIQFLAFLQKKEF